MSAQSEPENPEPEQPEPEQPKPENLEPEQPKPENPEPEQPEPEQPKPENPEHGQPEPEKPEPEKPEPEKPEPEQPEPGQPEPEKPGSKIYYCEICKVPCMSAMILQTHFAGMRHKKRENALKRRSAPVIKEEPLTVKRPLSKTIRCLKDYMKDPNREEPLIGLEYVLEVRFQGRRDPCYECQLCQFNTEIVPMIEHLIGQRHRKGYIMKHFPDKGKRNPNETKEDRIRFLRRIAREIEKEDGLKMYKVEGYERPSDPNSAAKKARRWRGGFTPENDPVRRQKALEYMDFFEITSDTEATEVIRIAQSLSEALKAFCGKKEALKHIRSLPSLMPPGKRNKWQQKPNKPYETFDDNPGDTKWTEEPTSSVSYAHQMRERTSSYTEGSSELATVSALRKSLAPQSGNSAGGINKWMKQFSQSASVEFQSNPVREESLSGTSSQSSYPTQYPQQSSYQKYDNKKEDTGIRSWDNMRDSYSATREYPASCPSKDFPSRYNDGNSNQMAASLPAASNSLGWPPSSGYQRSNLQADGKAYQPPFSGGSLYNDYQQQNIQRNNMMGQSRSGLSSGLSSDIISQLRGKDPAVLARMLQELVPHYPDLRKVDIYALAQALSKIS